MLGKLFLVMLTLVVPFTGMKADSDNLAAHRLLRPLEVHISKPLKWKNGCLQVSIDRVNRSPNSIFIPGMGLYIASSATHTAALPGQRHGLIWFTVYGASDILDLSAQPLAPGGTMHNDECVGPNFAITDLKKKTRREIPLRGTLKIYANYFLTEQDWRTHKSQIEEMFRTPPNKWQRVLKPETATIMMPIPCLKATCNLDCDIPPVVLDGERMIIPDSLSYEREWNDRGKAVNDELEKLSTPCNTP